MSIIWKRTVAGSKDVNADTGTFESLNVTNFTVGDIIIDDLSLDNLTVSGSTTSGTLTISGASNLSTLTTSGNITVNGALATLPDISTLGLQFRTNATIRQNTSDGSDNRYIVLTGGGGDGSTRGGRIVLNGNENTGQEGRVQLFAGGTGAIQFLTNGDNLRAEFTSGGVLTLNNGITIPGGGFSYRNTGWSSNGDDVFITANNNWIHLRPEPTLGGKGSFFISLNSHVFRNNANVTMLDLNKDTNTSTWLNGSTLNVGTSGTTSNLNVYGLLTTQNGLTVASGTTTTQALNVQQALTASTTLNVTGTSTLGLTSVLNTVEFRGNSIIKQDTADGSDNRYTIVTGGGADGNDRGGRIVMSGNERVTFGGRVQIYAGTTAPIEFFTNGDTLRASIDSTGLFTAQNGITLVTGQTLNVGTSGTTSPANIYGLLTVSNGITLTGGTLNVPSITSGSATYSGAVVVNDSTASTSNSTGAVRTTGGISSSNTTDATSSTNGGSGTLGGGLAVAKKLFTGETITSGQSIVIGQNGSQAAGSIYSDANWGMLLRARQASPSQAEYRFANSANTSLMDITGTLVTTGLKIYGNSTTDYSFGGNDAAIKTDGGLRVAKRAYAAEGYYVPFGKGLYTDPNWTNTKMIESENGRVGGLTGDALYMYTPGSSSGSGANPIMGLNTTSVRNFNTTQSTSLSTGAAIIDGGMALAKNLYCGGDINLTGNYFGGTVTNFTPSYLTDTTVTYTTQIGRYTRIGAICFISIRLTTTTAISLSSQNLTVLNLPFNNANVTQNLWTVATTDFAFPSGTDYVYGVTGPGNNSIVICASRDDLPFFLELTAPSTVKTRTLVITGFMFTS
jgi:hypothetical protein